MTRAHVGVNLLWLVPGVVGGSETYFSRLLAGVAGRGGAVDHTLFVLPQFAGAHPELAAAFPTVVAPVTGRNKPLRVAAESTWLAARSHRAGLDLVHHGGGHVPVVRGAPAVCTVHDLQYVTHPEWFGRTKLAFLRLMVPGSVRRARVVLTLSEYVRGRVIEAFDVAPERVVVIPHSVDGDAQRPEGSDPDDLRRRHRIDGPFFFYPAITYPHKNHGVLVDAMATVTRAHPDAHLVFTGGPASWGTVERDLDAAVDRLGLAARVRRLGWVDAADRETLYHEAVATVFPSRYEGFGVPVLEAMARHCPVIASDVTALPEVVGDAGRLVGPDDRDGWADAMCAMLGDEATRRSLIEAGRARASLFTAERSAGLLEIAYRQALATA